MYEDFYYLREKPFNLTPSPRFLYLSEGHKEALSLLKYGVMERMGFILLTGEVGTGKTTMVRALLDSLSSTVKYVLLSNPLLSPEDLFNYLALSTFKKKVQFSSKTHFLLVFKAYLKQALKNQTNFNLIIDEAHKLSFELLEEIRLLSNMETGDEKLINIFLVGQPELNKKLCEPICRPLLQRISIRYHIPPLNFEETREYMETRLKVAGAKKLNQVFSKSAVDAVYGFSRGFPREINVLSDNALLFGYAKGIRKITSSMVRACYEDLQIKGLPTREDSQETDFPAIREAAPPKAFTKWQWAAVLLLLFAFFAGALSPTGKRIFSQFVSAIPSTYSTVLEVFTGHPVTAENEVEWGTQALAKTDPEKYQKPIYERSRNQDAEKVEIEKISSVEKADNKKFVAENTGFEKKAIGKTDPEKSQKPIYERSRNQDAEKVEIEKISSVEKADSTNFIAENEKFNEFTYQESPLMEQDIASSKITVTVKGGDTLAELAMAVYGRADTNTLKLVQQRNPTIEDINWIYVGQKVVFPKLSISNKAATFTVHIASYKPSEPAFRMFQKLMQEGYEVYMMPAYNLDNGKIFRITLGTFERLKEAEDYAATILEEGISDYAKAVQLEMK